MMYVKEAKGKGVGLFASRLILAGEIIDECSVLPLSAAEASAIELAAPRLHDYLFLWEQDNDGGHAIALSSFSFSNHSFTPNTRVERDFKRRMLRIIAIRDILAHEELTHTYMNVWFDVHEQI